MAKLSLPCLKLPPFSLYGSSVAGIATAMIVKELNLCFDVANGWGPLTTVKNILITHGHMDHAGGLPYILSQKALTSQPPPNIYLPKAVAEPMSEIMALWQKIEGHSYSFQFTGVENDFEYPLKGNFFFKAFPTVHRVPSHGYTVFERKKHLNPDYQGLPREKILALKSSGEEVEEHFDKPLLSFTGDTQIEFLDGPAWAHQAKYLFMEVSFIDQRRSVSEARKWGHIHFDEFVENFHKIQAEKIVLLHLSKRYSVKDAEAKVREAKLDPERVLVFPQLDF